MIVQCKSCEKYFDDEYRDTICGHKVFSANDGNNNFNIHEDAYLSNFEPGDLNHLAFSILHGSFNDLHTGGCSCMDCIQIRKRIEELKKEEVSQYLEDHYGKKEL